MKKKILTRIFTALMLVVLTLSFASCTQKTNDKLLLENNDFIVNVQDNEQIRLTKRYASGDGKVHTSYTIVAVVDAVDGVDTSLNWTIGWSDSTYTETVSDYVSLTVSSDTLSVDINMISPFSRTIVLKATSVATPSVSATCTINCYARVVSTSLNMIAKYSGVEKVVEIVDNQSIALELEEVNYSTVAFDTIEFTPTFKGTVDCSIVDSLSITMSDELIAVCEANGIAYEEGYTRNIDDYNSYTLCDFIYIFITDSMNLSTDEFAELMTTLGETTSHFFDLHVTYSYENMEGWSKIFTYAMTGFDVSYYSNRVNSIILNNSSIIF